MVLLAVVIPLAGWAGSASPQLLVTKPPVLDTCPEVFDPELDNIRGRYEAYYFGLDIILDLTGPGPSFTLTPHANMPPETVISPSGISFDDGQVSYRGGIRPHSIFQAVQVTGDKKIVMGVINLNILIPQTMLTGRPAMMGLTKGSLSGLKNY